MSGVSVNAGSAVRITAKEVLRKSTHATELVEPRMIFLSRLSPAQFSLTIVSITISFKYVKFFKAG